jgi:hypothetical protein
VPLSPWGFLEVRPSGEQTAGEWQTVDEVSYLMDCNPFPLGSFFGVHNEPGYRPLAADSGIPVDASPEVAGRAEQWAEFRTRDAGVFCEPSGVTWDELDAMDLDEPAGLEPDPHGYPRWFPSHLLWEPGRDADPWGFEQLPTEECLLFALTSAELEVEGERWRVRVATRRDTVRGGWARILSQMRELAGQYGAANVRWVVWFDA